MISLSFIEDDATISHNLTSFIGFYDDIELVSSHDSVESFLHDSHTKLLRPEILLLDIGLRGMTGLDGIMPIRAEHPELDIIMLTTYDDEDKIVRALRSGACSYLSKKISLEKIIEAVRLVHEGGSYMSPSIARKLSLYMMKDNSPQPSSTVLLSPKQEQVIQGLVDGLSYKAIASQLDISVSTVKTHIKRIYQALHVSNKAEAVAKYLKS